MASIFSLSSISQPPPLPSAWLITDKTVHAALYGGLSLVMLRALSGGLWRGVTIARGFWSAIGATMYGISDEIHQRFTPGRMYDVADMVADGIGAAVAVVVILAWGIIRRHVVRQSAGRA